MPPPKEMPHQPVPWACEEQVCRTRQPMQFLVDMREWLTRRPRNSVASEESALEGSAMPNVRSLRGHVLNVIPDGPSV